MPTATRIHPSRTPSRDASIQGSLAASPTGLAAVYRRRQPTTTRLYPIVQHHLETFLARAEEADPRGEGVPRWVERDFRAYLRCGILAYGFARVRCDDCATERLVAFSCKGRGVCPSCNARRMAEVAAHLADHVLPPLPARQWVFSLPKRIRPFLPRDPALAGAVLRARLLARIYEVFPLRCPECAGQMRILACLADPAPIAAILRHLHLPTTPPAIAPARAPPQHNLAIDSEPALVLDQTPAFDPAAPEPVPDLQFDQSAGA